MGKKITTEEFVRRAKEVHGDKYDYSESEYTWSGAKIKITCKKHGPFMQSAKHHLYSACGCNPCGVESAAKKASKTTEWFIDESRKIHGNLYDYSLTNYKNNRTKVIIICKTHGPFKQSPYGHCIKGDICKKCSIEQNAIKARTTIEKFIKRAKKKHGDKYNYSFVEYIGTNKNVKILCPQHGFFYQAPTTHYKYGCNKCSNNEKSEKYTITHEQFIDSLSDWHKENYDYTDTIYKNSKIEINYICKIHGEISQLPCPHKRKGCPQCGYDRLKLTTEEFIEKARSIHGDKYDYSLVKYKSTKSHVKIICKKHGVFKQRPMVHLVGCGCQKCKSSNGEQSIESVLAKYNIKKEEQKKFENAKYLKSKYQMVFDFYLPDYNLLIEYDGEQHFRAIDYFGGEKEFKQTKRRDAEKNEYCLTNNIKLLRIPYTEFDNIEEILKEKLNLK